MRRKNDSLILYIGNIFESLFLLGEVFKTDRNYTDNQLSNYYKQPTDLGLDTHGSQQLWWFTNQYPGKKNGLYFTVIVGRPAFLWRLNYQFF